MKVLSNGKHLWMRTIGSTAVGQAVDTVIVIGIIFAGNVPLSTMLTLMASGYGGKVLYEALATPLTYAVVNWLKKVEGVDIMDTNTDFNPFRAKLASR
jgi:queuosine precursor transporter